MYTYLETEMIILARTDVFAAWRNTQCRDIICVTAEKSLPSSFDVPYGNLMTHRIQKMLLIRMQSQGILCYALKNERICKIINM